MEGLWGEGMKHVISVKNRGAEEEKGLRLGLSWRGKMKGALNLQTQAAFGGRGKSGKWSFPRKHSTV